MRTRFVLGAAFTMFMLLGTAKAGIIYDNGGPNTVPPQTGLPIKFFTTADDFTLASTATIRSVGFYVQADTGIAGWNRTVDYAFLSDFNGSPLSVLATGTAQNLILSDSGLKWCCSTEHAYLAQFDLQGNFVAGPGTYWLQLGGATGSSPNVYWVTTGGGAGTNTAFWEGSHSGGYQVAFVLSDTAVSTAQAPEPASIALSGLGFVALALAAHRRKHWA